MHHRRLEVTVTQAEEAVAMIGHHGVYAIIRGADVAFGQTLIVVGGIHAAEHPLPVTEVIIGREDQVVGTAGLFGWIMAIDRKVGEAAAINGQIRLPVVGKLHVVDTATGTGQEDEIAIEPVNIEIVAVEALACQMEAFSKAPVKLGRSLNSA